MKTDESRPRDTRTRGVLVKVTEREYEQIATFAAGEARPTATWIYSVVRKEIARLNRNASQNRARAIRRLRNTPASSR